MRQHNISTPITLPKNSADSVPQHVGSPLPCAAEVAYFSRADQRQRRAHFRAFELKTIGVFLYILWSLFWILA